MVLFSMIIKGWDTWCDLRFVIYDLWHMISICMRICIYIYIYMNYVCPTWSHQKRGIQPALLKLLLAICSQERLNAGFFEKETVQRICSHSTFEHLTCAHLTKPSHSHISCLHISHLHMLRLYILHEPVSHLHSSRFHISYLHALYF